MASTVIAKPNWAQLPFTPRPAWHDSQKVRRVASAGFALVGVGLLASTYYLTLRLPQFVLAIAAAAVARKIFSAPINNLETLLAQRIQAGAEIEASGTFKDFRVKYRDLLARHILVETDICWLIERDVQVLDYAPFIEKHVDSACQNDIVGKLQPFSRELLTAKCLAFFAANPSRPRDVVAGGLLSQVGLSADQKALQSKSWDEFVQKRVSIADVKGAEPFLKDLFLAAAYQRKVDLGDLENAGFCEEIEEEITRTMIVFELELIAEGKLPASKMSWAQEGELTRCLELVPAVKPKLAAHALETHSYDVLTQDINRPALEELGITDAMIDAKYATIRSDCKRLDFLGEEGFSAIYGNAALQDGSLTPDLIDKIKNELREKLPDIDVIDEPLSNAVIILRLEDEILVPRWKKMSFLKIWEKEKSFFLDSCKRRGGATQFRLQIIEALKDAQIYQLDLRGLFPDLLLPSGQSASGKTFAQLAEEFIQEHGHLEALFFKTYDGPHSLLYFLQLFIELKFINYDSPAIRIMLEKNIDAEGETIFNSGTWKKFVEMWKVVNPEVSKKFLEVSEELRTAREKVDRSRWSIEGESSQERQALKNEVDRILGLLEKTKKQREEVERQLVGLTHKLQNSQNEEMLERLRSINETQHSILKGIPDINKRIEAEIADLKAQTAPSGQVLIQMAQEAHQGKRELEQMKSRFNMFASRDVIIQGLEDRLKGNSRREDACLENIRKTQVEIDRLEAELSKLVELKAELQTQVRALNREVRELQEAYKKAHEEDSYSIKMFQASKEERINKLENEFKLLAWDRLVAFTVVLMPELKDKIASGEALSRCRPQEEKP